MRLHAFIPAFSGLLLLLSLACGGSSTPQEPAPTPAKGFIYTNPTGTGWRLVQDAASTPGNLVLNLVGPASAMTRGVALHLQAPAGVKFGTFPGGLAIQDGGVYDLLSDANDPTEPLALVAGLKEGNVLSAGIFQKSRTKPAKASGNALCRFTLRFDSTADLQAGDALPLKVLKARVIPEDIGTPTDSTRVLDQKMRMSDISIAVGSLSAQ